MTRVRAGASRMSPSASVSSASAYTPSTSRAPSEQPAEADSSALDMRSLDAALRTVTSDPQSSRRGATASPENNSGRLLSPESQRGSQGPATPRRSRRSSSRAIQRHQVVDEELPQQRYHHPAFQEALRDSKRLVSELTQVLSTSTSSLHNEPDSTMRKLYKEAQELCVFDCPAKRTVGFVGDSGVGKSSLINCLLDTKGLARTSSSLGAACTCVVTEYHYHSSNDFAIEVDWFSQDDIMAQVLDLLEAYRHYHLGLADDATDDEKKNWKDRADVAHDTFKAVFRNHLRSRRNSEFLLGDDESEVVAQLEEWLEERGLDSEMSRIESLPSAKACTRRLMELTSETSSPEQPSLWPFIRKIIVHVNASILGKGLILVDLPGLRDLNSARRAITERYIFKVDEIFAVCSIDRATTNAGVADVIDLAKKARLSKVGIICTKSDEIKAEEAEKDWKGQEQLKLRDLMDAVGEEDENMKEITAEIDELDEDDDTEERRQLLEARLRSEKQLAKHSFALKSHLITTRNDIVVAELDRLYRSSIQGNNLSVFCVSNHDYWDHRTRQVAAALPALKLSGILDVRRHCIAIVSEAQYQAARLYMSEAVPALLSSLQLWVESGSGSLSAERKGAIRVALERLEGSLKGITPSDWDVNESPLEQHFRTHIVQNYRFVEWAGSARSAADEWSELSPMTYIAFCRNYGDHCTPAAGRRNWNEEAIARMVRDLEAPWTELDQGVLEWQEYVQSAAASKIDHGIEILREHLESGGGALESLVRLLQHRQRLLAADLEEMFETEQSHFSQLERDALSSFRTSLIGEAMSSSYRACNMEGGRGSDARRKRIISQKVGDRQLFEELAREMKKRWWLLAEQLNDKIVETMEVHVEVVMENMAILRDENVALESEREPAFRTRVQAEVSRVQDALKSIEAGMSQAS